MKLEFAIICITAVMLCCCSSRKGQPDVSVQNDSLSVASEEMEDAGNSSLDNDELPNLADIEKRVAKMYDDIIEHYNTNSISNWDSHELYFSDSLKWLYSQLPADDIIIDWDPWTWSQDYDTLAYKKVEVVLSARDRAQATVTLSLGKDTDQPVVLELIREKHGGENEQPEWYVNDIRSGTNSTWTSVADDIRDYIKNDKQK